jgi:hypothetical protein
MLGKGGALLGLAAAVLLTAGGVGAAVATQVRSTLMPSGTVATGVVPVLDEPPTTTTTTAPPSAAQPGAVIGGQGVTITVVIKR